MAPIDAQNLKPNKINTGVDGIKWISYRRTKSKVSAFVPLGTPAVSLIEKYLRNENDPPRNTIFPFVNNQMLNRIPKSLGSFVSMSFH